MCVETEFVNEIDAVFSGADTVLMLKRADGMAAALRRIKGNRLRSCNLSSGSVFTDRLRIARSSWSSKTKWFVFIGRPGSSPQMSADLKRAAKRQH